MPRRRGYQRRRQTVKQVAYKALRKANAAERKKEVKHNAITIADTTPSTAGAIEEVSVVPEGDTNNSRDGDLIFPTSLRFRARMVQAGAATNSFIRIIVLRWISEVPAGVTDVLTATDRDWET